MGKFTSEGGAECRGTPRIESFSSLAQFGGGGSRGRLRMFTSWGGAECRGPPRIENLRSLAQFGGGGSRGRPRMFTSWGGAELRGRPLRSGQFHARMCCVAYVRVNT